MSSRLESILANYSEYANNQISSANEFKEQLENNQREAEKAATAGDENSLDMMALHFFGDKIKNFLSETLGLDTDEISKFTDNPTEYMKNAAKDVLNKASDTVEEQLEQRGLTPEGLMQRTEQVSRDAVDTMRRQLLDNPPEDEEEGEDDTSGTQQPDEPDEPEADDAPEPAPEPTQTPQSIVDNANDTEGFQSAAQSLRNLAEDSVGLERGSLTNASGESIARNLESYGDQPRQDIADGIRNLQTKFDAFQEPAAPEPEPTTAPELPEPEDVAPEPVSTAPFGGVRMPGSEELQTRFQSQISTPETASDAGQKLVSDITNHMRSAGEDDLADRIENGTAPAQEVSEKLQEQMDDPNDILQRGGTSRNASQLLERAQNLQEPEQQPPMPSQAASQAAEEASEAAADTAADAAISDELLLAA